MSGVWPAFRPGGQGWRIYRTDVPEEKEEPTLAAYCPVCAHVEAGFAVAAAGRRRG